MADNQSDIDKVASILDANASKSFVKRILSYQGPGKSPTLDLGGGQYATHKMAWTSADGRHFVYPTVLQGEDGQLTDYGPAEAWKHVKQTGNYIEFSTPQEADWFSRNYKLIWPSNLR
jgi:hypothetical protein